MDLASSPSTAIARMITIYTLTVYYRHHVGKRPICNHFGPRIQRRYSGHAIGTGCPFAVRGMLRGKNYLKIMFELSPSQAHERWAKRLLTLPSLPLIISAPYPAKIPLFILSPPSAHRSCPWILLVLPPFAASGRTPSKELEAMGLIKGLTGAQLIESLEAMMLASGPGAGYLSLPGQDIVPGDGAFPLTLSSRFMVERGTWFAGRESPRHPLCALQPRRETSGVGPRARATIIKEFYAALTPSERMGSTKRHGEPALGTQSVHRSLDESVRRGIPTWSAHFVEPAPKSTRRAGPIVTVAARTPFAVMILRLAKTSCRYAKPVCAPGPALFKAGYCRFPRSPVSGWIPSPAPASTCLPIQGKARPDAMSASGDCRTTATLQLEATRDGRGRLSGLLDDMTIETVRNRAGLDFLSSEFVWTCAQQPCRCVAAGAREQQAFVKFPTGRKSNAGTSLFFLPVGMLIRILLTVTK
jgi:hypothetical protein